MAARGVWLTRPDGHAVHQPGLPGGAALPDLPGAACAEVDPELWFPERGGGPAGDAKAICRRCPVQRDCLDWALDVNEEFGIWGGLSPSERAELRRGSRDRPPRDPDCSDCSAAEVA